MFKLKKNHYYIKRNLKTKLKHLQVNKKILFTLLSNNATTICCYFLIVKIFFNLVFVKLFALKSHLK